jgi:hypothetical protein
MGGSAPPLGQGHEPLLSSPCHTDEPTREKRPFAKTHAPLGLGGGEGAHGSRGQHSSRGNGQAHAPPQKKKRQKASALAAVPGCRAELNGIVVVVVCVIVQ